MMNQTKTMLNHKKMMRKKKSKFRFSYACFILFFVSLAMIAMTINVKMVQDHRHAHAEQQQHQQESSLPGGGGRGRGIIAKKQDNKSYAKQLPIPKESTSDTEKRIYSSVVQQKDKKKIIHIGEDDDGNNKDSTIHVVFSTSCHVKQDWQSYVFFFQAMTHDQQGTVTRVVSGCDESQEIQMRQVFQEQIQIMNPNFKIHFTPEYGKVPGKSYQSTKYWNKPFSLRHWLESDNFGYNFDNNKLSTTKDDDVIVLVDPDMLMQRPFVNYFPQYMDDLWISPIRNGKDVNFPKLRDRVSHGKPMAQDYSFGSAWLTSSKANLTHVVGTTQSHVHQVSDFDARVYYSAGPPYIATSKDMYQISYYWTKFLPKIFDLFPKFMAEM